MATTRAQRDRSWPRIVAIRAIALVLAIGLASLLSYWFGVVLAGTYEANFASRAQMLVTQPATRDPSGPFPELARDGFAEIWNDQGQVAWRSPAMTGSGDLPFNASEHRQAVKLPDGRNGWGVCRTVEDAKGATWRVTYAEPKAAYWLAAARLAGITAGIFVLPVVLLVLFSPAGDAERKKESIAS